MRDKKIIIEKIKYLWEKTKIHDMECGCKNNYELEIGKNVYKILLENFYVENPTIEMRLLGIPVRINHYNPDEIKLWMEVIE